MTRPAGSAVRPLERQCEWTAAELTDESMWTVEFDDRQREELDRALRHAFEVSDSLLDIEREHFPLPTLSTELAAIERELIDGRGFVRLRGVERAAYSDLEMEMIYWGIGLHLGEPWPQNHHGHVLGDVTDQQVSRDDPTTRGNEIGGAALPFHTDGSDLVGLMCLANGIAGGMSVVANAVAIHNELVDQRPELAAVLYERYPYDYRGEEAPGSRPWYSVPVFTEWNDRLFVRCIPTYIHSSQRHPDAPRLSELQIEALDTLIELAERPEHQVRMELRPGDMQFIDNYHVLHGRTAYDDDRAGGAVRHLKRLWLETSVLADRPPHFRRPVSSHWSERRSASHLRVS